MLNLILSWTYLVLLSTPVCQTTQRGPVLGSTPDFSSGVIPGMTLKLSDCAITINSWVWQTWKVSHCVVSPTPQWESLLLMWNDKGEPTLEGYSTSSSQDKSKDSKDLVQSWTYEGHWSYVRKIQEGVSPALGNGFGNAHWTGVSLEPAIMLSCLCVSIVPSGLCHELMSSNYALDAELCTCSWLWLRRLALLYL